MYVYTYVYMDEVPKSSYTTYCQTCLPVCMCVGAYLYMDAAAKSCYATYYRTCILISMHVV
jgi:hypothetical protein